MKIVVNNLKDSEIVHLRETFENFDIEKKGVISASDIKYYIKTFSMNDTDEEITRIVEDCQMSVIYPEFGQPSVNYS